MAGCVGVGGGGNQGKVRRSDGVGGMFFVEGTFYVHGGDRDIDYAGPVLQWLGLEDEHNNGGGTDDDKKDADEENQGDDVEEEGGRDGRRKKRASSESAAARTSRSLGILRRNYLGIPSSPSATAHLEEEEKRKGRGRPRKNDAAGKRSDGVCTRKKKSGGGGGKKGSKEKKVRKTAPAVSGEEARGDKTAPAAAADAVAASGNDANNEKDGARRPYVRQMSETLLIDVPFRLGVRYYHCWDGDCESSLFFTDVRRIIPTIPPALAAPALGISPALPTVSADDTNRTKNGATAAHRPKVVIHDLWTSPFQPSSSTSSGSGGRILSAPTDKSCRGCRRRPPSSAVYCDEWCDGDGGGGDPPLTPLCSMCLWTLRGGYKEGGGGRDGDGNDEDTGAGTRDNGKDEIEGKGDQGEGEGKDRGVGISPRPPPPPFRTYPLRLLKDAADMSVGHLPTDAHFD
uniref:Uncharacterized protein n=1 Tax=Odontella aurita TaxID=265563 RepID=A0A6U6FF17_9STRA